MNAPFTLDDLASRNMNPEKLEALQRVFEDRMRGSGNTGERQERTQ